MLANHLSLCVVGDNPTNATHLLFIAQFLIYYSFGNFDLHKNAKYTFVQKLSLKY